MVKTETRNPYDILGVAENATREEIKKAYRKLSAEWHPDKHESEGGAARDEAEERMKDIAWAWSVLRDEKARKRYDTHGEAFIQDVETEAMTYVRKAFMAIVANVWVSIADNGDGPDIIGICFKRLYDIRTKEKQDLSMFARQKAATERILAKLMTDREDDFLTTSLEEERRKIMRNISVGESNLEVLERAEEILHEYSCDMRKIHSFYLTGDYASVFSGASTSSTEGV